MSLADTKEGPSFWGFINFGMGFPKRVEAARLPELAKQGFSSELWRMHGCARCFRIRRFVTTDHECVGFWHTDD